MATDHSPGWRTAVGSTGSWGDGGRISDSGSKSVLSRVGEPFYYLAEGGAGLNVTWERVRCARQTPPVGVPGPESVARRVVLKLS
jgi:hypothetical protein